MRKNYVKRRQYLIQGMYPILNTGKKDLFVNWDKEIFGSHHENHHEFIFECMCCREVLRQIKDRLESSEGLQIMKIIDHYSKIRDLMIGKRIEH